MSQGLRVLGLAAGIRLLTVCAMFTLDALAPDYDSSGSLQQQDCTPARLARVPESALPRSAAVPDSPRPGRAASAPAGPRNGKAPHQSDWLTGLAVWDSAFFVRVARCGYEYEQFHAFFPLLPLLLRAALCTGPRLRLTRCAARAASARRLRVRSAPGDGRPGH